MRSWIKEVNYRVSARVDLYNVQVELPTTLIHTAVHELVSQCITNALQAYADDPCARLDTAERLPGRLLTSDWQDVDDEPYWPVEQVVAEMSHAAQSQSPDDGVLYDAEQAIAEQ